MIGLAAGLIGTKGAINTAGVVKSSANKIQGITKTNTNRKKMEKKRADYAKKLFKDGGLKNPTPQNIKDKQHLRKYDKKLLHTMGLTEDEINWD